MSDKVYDDIRNMDWGILTADFINDKTNTVLHVCNHDLSTDDSLDRTIRFAKGRIRWFDTFCNQAFNHVVVIDDFGQSVSLEEKNRIRSALSGCGASVVFDSER